MAIPVQVVFDCADPPVIARFWADALGYQLQGPPGPTAAWRAWLIEHGVLQEHRDDASAIIDPDGSGPRIYFQRVPEPRRHRHHHLDLRSLRLLARLAPGGPAKAGPGELRLREYRVSWDFTDRCFSSFRGADQRLPEQRRIRRRWSGQCARW
jgi:Glyoxalase-like domain